MEKIKEEQPGTIKSFSIPRLTPEEKLYLRVYLHTLSHAKAYEAVKPGLKGYACYNNEDNQFSRRESLRYHIALGLQEKAEALTLSKDVVLERLYKEALREGAGSNHAARIQALTLLGKHLGLFEEKKEDNSFTFNIINYSSEPVALEKKEDNILEEIQIESQSPSPINFIEYTQEEINDNS